MENFISREKKSKTFTIVSQRIGDGEGFSFETALELGKKWSVICVYRVYLALFGIALWFFDVFLGFKGEGAKGGFWGGTYVEYIIV